MSLIAESGIVTPPRWATSSLPFTPSPSKSTTVFTPVPSIMTSNFQTNSPSGSRMGSGTPANQLLNPTSFPILSSTVQLTSEPPVRMGITPPYSGLIQSSAFLTNPVQPSTILNQQDANTTSITGMSTQSSLSASFNGTTMTTSPISRPPTPLTLPTDQSRSNFSTSFESSEIGSHRQTPLSSASGSSADMFKTTSNAVSFRATPGATTVLDNFGDNGLSTPTPGWTLRNTPTPAISLPTTSDLIKDNGTSFSSFASAVSIETSTEQTSPATTDSTSIASVEKDSTVSTMSIGSSWIAQDQTASNWTRSWSNGGLVGGSTETTANGVTQIGWIVASPFAIPLVVFAIVLGVIVVVALLGTLLWCICTKCCTPSASAKKYPRYASEKKKLNIIDDLKLPPFVLARLLEDELTRPLLNRDDVTFYKHWQLGYDNNNFQDKLPNVVAQFGNNEPQYKTVVKVPWPLDYNSANQAVPTYAASKAQPSSNSLLRTKNRNKKGSSIDDDPFDVNYPFANYPANRFSSRPSYAYSNYATNPLYHSNAKTPLFGGLTDKERARMYPRLSAFSPLSVSQMLLPTYSAAQRPAAVVDSAAVAGGDQMALDQPDGRGRGKKRKVVAEQKSEEKKHTTVVHIGSAGKASGLVIRNEMIHDASSALVNPKSAAAAAGDVDEFRSVVVLD